MPRTIGEGTIGEGTIGERLAGLLNGPTVTLTPKPGTPASTDGSLGALPWGEYVDLGAIIAAGGITTDDVSLTSLLLATGLFVQS